MPKETQEFDFSDVVDESPKEFDFTDIVEKKSPNETTGTLKTEAIGGGSSTPAKPLPTNGESLPQSPIIRPQASKFGTAPSVADAQFNDYKVKGHISSFESGKPDIKAFSEENAGEAMSDKDHVVGTNKMIDGLSDFITNQLPANLKTGFAASSEGAIAASQQGVYPLSKEKISEASKGIKKEAIKSKDEADEITAKLGLTQKIGDIKTPRQAIEYVFNTVGQAGVQIPAAIATFGTSSFFQEAGQAYADNVKQIAKEKGLTTDQVIDQGLDNPALSTAVGTVSAALDYVGAGKVLGSIGKQGIAKAIKGALTEGVTEAAQGQVQKAGQVAGSDQKKFADLATIENLKDAGEEFASGVIGGAGMTAVGNATANSIASNANKIQAEVLQPQEQVEVPVTPTENINATPETESGANDTPLLDTNLEENGQIPNTDQQPASDTGATEPGVAEANPEIPVSEGPDQPTSQGGVEVNPQATIEAPNNLDQTQTQTEEQKLSGIKKALVPDEKIEDTEIERRSTEQVLLKAKEAVDNGEIDPQKIVNKIAGGDKRALQPDEVGALVYYKTQLDNKSDTLNDQLIKAIEDKDESEQSSLRTQIEALNSDIDKYHTMALYTAYEQSLAFRLRKTLLDSEYNIQTQIRKYKAANNGQISPETEAKFAELDKQLKDATAKIQELETRQAANGEGDALRNIQKEVEREKPKPRERRGKDLISDGLDELTSALGIKLSAVGDNNPKIVSALAKIGRGLIDEGLATTKNVAEKVRQYVSEKFGDKINYDDHAVEVSKAIEESTPKVEIRNGKLNIPEKLIKQFVRDGATDINDLTDKLHDYIDDPEVSKRQVRDAVTKYGKTANLSKEEIDVKLREFKRVGKLISGMEDVQNKKRPLRSGLQRDKLTDQERKMNRDLKEAIKDLPIDQDELDRTWKTALDGVKSRLKNQIVDLEKQIETGEKSAQKKGIKYDAEATELQKQRDDLKAIIEETEGKPKLSDEQKTRMAVKSVEKGIADLERRIKEKDFSVKQKPTPVSSEQLVALRKQREDLQAVYKKLETDLGFAEKKRLDNFKKAIVKSTQRYEEKLKNKDFEMVKMKPLELDREAEKLKIERNKIKEQFDIEQEKVRLQNRPMSEKIFDMASDVWNIPKSLLSSIDLSAPLRQGYLLSVANPKIGAQSFVEMFRQAFSEKRATDWLHRLREQDDYSLMKESKLYLSEPNVKLSAKEESFVSNIAEKLPVIGKVIAGSSRAYTGFLNKLRADTFSAGVDQLKQSGITPNTNPEAYKALASFINNATGRGNLGALENSAVVLNNFFFSPRYVASRLNLINPVYYAKMPPKVRQMALKNVASMIGFNLLLLYIAQAAGAEVEWDPRSSDFGKIKIGNVRYDVWAGFQQPVRFLAQLISGQRKSTKTGKIVNLDGKGFKGQDRTDVIKQFARTKLAPTAGSAVNVLTGSDMMGKEVEPVDEALKLITPLYLSDLNKLKETNVPTMMYALFGGGVQVYDK